MPKSSELPAVRLPTSKEDKAIIAAARSDPDAQPLTPRQLKTMVPLAFLRKRAKEMHDD